MLLEIFAHNLPSECMNSVEVLTGEFLWEPINVGGEGLGEQ